MSKVQKDKVPGVPYKEGPLEKLLVQLDIMNYQKREYTLGRVLTIIDAAITDPEQRKGIKDLIKNAYWDRDDLWSITGDILLQFAGKYAPDLYPKDNDREKRMLGTNNIGVRVSSQSYFPED